MGERFKIHGEVLGDAVEYIHNCGDVLWLQNHHKLKHTVFHKPLKLIESLRGIIHHNLQQILDFEENKSFSSIGKLSQVQYYDVTYITIRSVSTLVSYQWICLSFCIVLMICYINKVIIFVIRDNGLFFPCGYRSSLQIVSIEY